MSTSTTREEPRRGLTGFPQILILLFGAMFLGGGGAAPVAKRVKKAVKDDERRAVALPIAEALDALPGQVVDDLVATHREFYAALMAAEPDPDGVRASLDEMIERLHRADERALELRFELRDGMTSKEWEKVWGDDAAVGDWRP